MKKLTIFVIVFCVFALLFTACKTTPETAAEEPVTTSVAVAPECEAGTCVWGNWTESAPATVFYEGTDTRICENCKKAETRSVPYQSYFYGTWTRKEGRFQPYTITITEKTFNFVDVDNNKEKGKFLINFDNITWKPAVNNVTDANDAVDYEGRLANPKDIYPEGYVITGTRSVQDWTTSHIPNGFFMALSADRKTLYIAESDNKYLRARFVHSHMSDSEFTRQ